MLDSISISLSLPPIPPRLAPRSSHPSALPLLITPLQSGHRQIVRRRSRTNMSSEHRRLSSPANYSELNDESDFETIVSPDGFISIWLRFPSLRSARSTFPDLIKFRVARLTGFRRVFAHAAPIFFERGIAKPETKEISSLSVEPCEDETLIVTVFEIQKSEIPAFIERELEFRFLAVQPTTLDGKPLDNLAVLCARSSDEEFFKFDAKGDLPFHPLKQEIYFQHYGRYNIDKIWRNDILPCRVYLRHWNMMTSNLVETKYWPIKTTIREYFATAGSGIMEEEPPESLKTRYDG
ncbi:hypothetical protein I3843_01G135800 [Carya illinoinensis]|nr:hypothetical protein I3843_01G135800 [Carya illinoinensis]